MQSTLPVVVEFDHRHAVKVVNDGHRTKIVATPNPKWVGKYRRMHDLPFVGKPAEADRYMFWYFPKAANQAEAEARGEFFWNEFVAFARGTRRRRDEDARFLLEYLMGDMARYRDGIVEARVFLRLMQEALVAHLRVGIEP